jgi:hypothetical protein
MGMMLGSYDTAFRRLHYTAAKLGMGGRWKKAAT